MATIKKEDAIAKAVNRLMTPAPIGAQTYEIMKLLEKICNDLYQTGYDNGQSHAQADNIIKGATGNTENQNP